MNRIVLNQRGNTVGSFSWVAPAGVTVIYLQVLQGTTLHGYTRSFDVTPNTSYTITIVSTTYQVNNTNTFGSLFTFTGGGRVNIYWTE